MSHSLASLLQAMCVYRQHLNIKEKNPSLNKCSIGLEYKFSFSLTYFNLDLKGLKYDPEKVKLSMSIYRYG